MTRIIKLVIIVVVLVIVAVVVVSRHKTDPDVLLLDAAENGDLATVKSLLQGGASINHVSSVKFGWTPLQAAIFHNNTNVVHYLVESGADVNLPDRNGLTPLMLQLSEGDEGLPMVKYLVAHGANLDAKDKNGVSVMSYAHAAPPRPEIIEFLERAKQEQKKESPK